MKNIEGRTQRPLLPSEEKQISLNLLLLNTNKIQARQDSDGGVGGSLPYIYLWIPDMYSIVVEYVSYI